MSYTLYSAYVPIIKLKFLLAIVQVIAKNKKAHLFSPPCNVIFRYKGLALWLHYITDKISERGIEPD